MHSFKLFLSMASFVLRTREKPKEQSTPENAPAAPISNSPEVAAPSTEIATDPMQVDTLPAPSQPIGISGHLLSPNQTSEERAPTAEELRRARLARFGIAAPSPGTSSSPPMPSTPTQNPFLTPPVAAAAFGGAARAVPMQIGGGRARDPNAMDVDTPSKLEGHTSGTSPHLGLPGTHQSRPEPHPQVLFGASPALNTSSRALLAILFRLGPETDL